MAFAPGHGALRSLMGPPPSRCERKGGSQPDHMDAFSEQRGSEGSCGSSTSQPQRGKASLCRMGSRFARFEVRAEYLQAEHIKQHAESSAHRRAVIAWLNPDAPLRFAAQATLGDEQLLSGAVPPSNQPNG